MNFLKRSILILFAVFSISGCAMSQGMNSNIKRISVSYDNVGSSDVYDFMITFGNHSIPSRDGDDIFVKGGGGNFYNQMALPESMTVSWREASGKTHEESVQLSKFVPKGASRLIFVVNIKDSNLEVNLKIPKASNDPNNLESDIIPIRE